MPLPLAIYPLIGAAMGAGGVGAATNWFGLGKKKSQEPQFNYYESPDYKRLRDVLYNVYAQGIPGVGASARGQFSDEIMPQIRELYEAKKGFGSGATPEIAQLGQAGRGLERDIMAQDYQSRMGALNALSSITGRPTTTYTPEGPSDLENLFSFATPIASTALGAYMGQQDPLNKLMREYILGTIKPKGYENWFEVGNKGQSGWNYSRV